MRACPVLVSPKASVTQDDQTGAGYVHGAREPEFAEHRAAQADERRRQVKANESSEEAQAPE
jgi:hypothetical protein